VGAGTHPGAGLPGVLASAKIADDLIAKTDAVLETTPLYPALQPGAADAVQNL
jgi:hypothetical protein